MSQKASFLQMAEVNTLPLFFRPYWLDCSKNPWDVVQINYAKLPYYWIYHTEKKLGHTFLRNPHLTPFTGLYPPLAPPTNLDVEELLQSCLNALPGFDVMELDLLPWIPAQTRIEGYECSARRSNLLHLNDENTLYGQLKPALKRQIKKARQALIIEERDSIDDFYSLHVKTFAKQQRKPSIDPETYKRYWTCSKANDSGKLFFARDTSGNFHAALWLAYDHHSAYYLAGGTDHQYYGSGAMSLLMWHAILKSLEMGKQVFDFEGSMLPSVNRFFKNFNPIEYEYLHLKKVNSWVYKLLKK